MPTPRQLVTALRKALYAHADPEKAGPMQAYMKSEMPFLGVQAAPRKAACRTVFNGYVLADAEAWQDAVLMLWEEARYREERYAAVELTGYRAYRKYQTLDALPLYETLIVTGAWWDYVDPIATHRIGGLLRQYPETMKPLMAAWAQGDDHWKRRTAIISQMFFREQTDRDLLYACIEPSLSASDFFLRKAIGWALRQYARTDPDEVRRYVAAHAQVLSGLSKREALKHLRNTA